MEIWSAFIVGLIGSVHCIGMCGPIAFAIPFSGDNRIKFFLSRILYNFGRIVTYSFFGLIFGYLGSRVILYGLQQDVSIVIGALIILYVLIPRRIKNKISATSYYMKIVGSIRGYFNKLIQKKSYSSYLGIGIINGFLPCGFVYVGIAGAISTGSGLSGAAYMMLFGLGTFPIMFAATFLGSAINLNIRKKINKLIPALALILGLLFVLRGMNLGIPYISPKFNHPTASSDPSHQHVEDCH